MTDICCIGHITRDKIITPENTVYMNGGTAFYFAHAINHLPKELSFSLITSMAEKDVEAVDELREAGIDVTFFPSRETVFFENKYGDNRDNRSQRVLAKADPFSVSQLNGVESRFFHLGSLLDDDFSPELIKDLSRRGIVSVDVQGFLRKVCGNQVFPTDWKDKDEVLRHIDILKLNEQEMFTVTGLRDPKKVALRIASWGVKEVLLTLGSNGSLIFAEGRFYDIPAYPPTQIVDATGCGDTYSAGYLYCRALGMGYGDSGRFAAAMCTQKLSHNGPFDGTFDEVEQIIARHRRQIV